MATLNSISPDQKPAGSGDFILTCIGTGFLGSRVNPDDPQIIVNGVGYLTTTTPNVGTQCFCTVPAAIIAAATSFDVWVTMSIAGDTAHKTFTVTTPIPIADTLTTASISAGSSTVIAVVGHNFTSSSVITIDGVTHTTTFTDAQHVATTSAIAFPEPGGVHTVGVSNPGIGDSNGLPFTVNNPAPTFTSLSPTSKLVGDAAFTLTINGTGFVHGVSVSGLNIGPPIDPGFAAVTWISSSQITISVASAALSNAGALTLTITNPTPGGGSVTTGSAFTVNNPAPTISSLTPSSASIGSGPITVTVNGAGFVSGTGATVVNWNGSPVATSFTSDSALTFTLTNAMLNASGTVTVTSGGPGGGTSGSLPFTINGGTPVLDYPTPAVFNFGSDPYVFTLIGSSFPASGWAIFLNGSINVTARGSYVNSGSINVSLLATDITIAGDYTLEVRNVPNSTVSARRYITIGNPAPTVSFLSSATKIAGDAAFTDTINGTGYVDGATIGTVNGSPRATVFVDSTRIAITITAQDLAAAGTLVIRAVTPGPGGGTSATSANLAVNNIAPVLSSLSLSAIVIGSGNTAIVLTGSGFLATSVVKVGASVISSVYGSASSITATIPSGSLSSIATLSLTVTNPTPGGGASGAQAVQVTNPAPTITNLSPNLKNAGDAGYTQTVNGTGFRTGNSTASWNGQVRATTVVSATQLTFAVLASDITAVGPNSIVVTNAVPGGGPSSPATLNVGPSNPVATISSITPNNLNQGSAAQSLAIVGTNFVAGSVVRWEGNDRATAFTDSTHISALLQSGDLAVPGSHAITVFNPLPGGGPSAAAGFVVNAVNPLPTITSISPPSIIHGSSGFTLHIYGTNFSALTTVSFGGSAKTPTLVNSTEITIPILAGDVVTAGTIPVIVTNPLPGGGSTPAANFSVDSGSNNPTPAITTLSLLSANVGATGSTVTITGNGFIATSQAKWNGSNRTTVFGSATSITIAILTSDLVAVGNFSVTVFNGTPGGGTSNPVSFAVLSLVNPAPILASLSPPSILRGVASFLLALFGRNMLPTTVATFNGANKTTDYVSPTQVNAHILNTDVALSPGAVTRINPNEHHEVKSINAQNVRSYDSGSAVAPAFAGPDSGTGLHFPADGEVELVSQKLHVLHVGTDPVTGRKKITA